MKKIFIALLLILALPMGISAKCVNSTSYTLKGYMEDASNDPVTSKTLSTVKFDVFYDDGTTASTDNSATAEMGQGWYRYSYTSSGKSGVWIMRDSGGTYKNFPGGILENLCDSQLIEIASTGVVGVDFSNIEGTLDASEIGTDAITAAKIAAAAITSSEAPNLDVAVSTNATPTEVQAELVTYDAVVPGDLETAANVATAVMESTIDGTKTLREVLCAMAAEALGKSSGMSTTTVTFRNIDDNADVIVGTMDGNYNRTAVTLTLTGCN
jgi:hypothetical protein